MSDAATKLRLKWMMLHRYKPVDPIDLSDAAAREGIAAVEAWCRYARAALEGPVDERQSAAVKRALTRITLGTLDLESEREVLDDIIAYAKRVAIRVSQSDAEDHSTLRSDGKPSCVACSMVIGHAESRSSIVGQQLRKLHVKLHEGLVAERAGKSAKATKNIEFAVTGVEPSSEQTSVQKEFKGRRGKRLKRLR